MDTTHVRFPARSPQRAELSKETAFELLSDRRRRYVLHALFREEGVATLGEVTSRLEAWDADAETVDIVEELRAVHLPEFEAAGVLAYYTASDVVELLGPAEDLRPYLELTERDDFASIR